VLSTPIEFSVARIWSRMTSEELRNLRTTLAILREAHVDLEETHCCSTSPPSKPSPPRHHKYLHHAHSNNVEAVRLDYLLLLDHNVLMRLEPEGISGEWVHGSGKRMDCV
jgi:hypothetical protein